MITYNQEKFIERAIHGVLSQKTGHSFEVVIGEDGSTDDTASVCREMAARFPSQIRLLPNGRNWGMIANFRRTLSACKGKYIALCDGDDYWTNEHKLQKQVSFLEANPDYAICCHRVYIKKDRRKPKLDEHDEFAPSTEATYDIEMLAKYGNLISTPSVVYRNNLFPELPGWFDQSPVGDYVLNMLNARYGKIKYFPEPMAVYRDHSEGAWGGRSVKENAAGMIRVIGLLLSEDFSDRVKENLKDQLRKIRALYLYELMQDDWDSFCKEYEKMLNEDQTIALELASKQRQEMEAVKRSRGYRIIQRIRTAGKGR